MRIAYRVGYLICRASGHAAAWLAARFGGLGRTNDRWDVLVVPLQLSLLMAS